MIQQEIDRIQNAINHNPWAAEIAVEAMEIIEYRVEREVVVGEEIIGATIAVRRLIGRAKDEQID